MLVYVWAVHTPKGLFQANQIRPPIITTSINSRFICPRLPETQREINGNRRLQSLATKSSDAWAGRRASEVRSRNSIELSACQPDTGVDITRFPMSVPSTSDRPVRPLN